MSEWSDAEMLAVLDRRFVRGETAGQIAKATGRSRSAVLGILHRIQVQTDAKDVSPHLNGTMPPHWWKKGLSARC